MTTQRKRGRPSIVEGMESAPASTSLPLPMHEQLLREASRRRVSVSELLRLMVGDFLSKNRQNVQSSVS